MGPSILILGGWGCGAFKGDPWLIAKLFVRTIAEAKLEVKCNPTLFNVWWE